MRISSAQKPVTGARRIEFNSSVVPGCNFLAPQAERQTIQRRKLQPAVAGHAGDRRLAIQITGNERLHHVALKLSLEVQHIEREAEFFGHAARIVNVIERTATRRQRLTILVHTDAAVLIPQLHREADQFMALLFQNRRRRGGVDAA